MKQNILKKLNSKLLKSVKYDNIPIWPIIRLKFFYQFTENNEGIQSRTRKFDSGNKLIALRNCFYGVRNIFNLRKTELLIFSSSERRKLLNGMYYDRIAEGVVESNKQALIIENPFPLGRHYPKSTLPNKRVLSESIFFLFVIFLGTLNFRKRKFQNEDILKKILKENNVSTLSYNRYLKIYLGQYKLMNLILKFAKPKAVLFVYSASSMGYIRAFKEHGIPVVEMQHGIVNKKHNAYNIYHDFGNLFYPDYIFTYGDKEKNIFNSNNHFIDLKNVLPIGYYFLDKCKQSYKADINYRKELLKKYKKIIAFSHQEIYEEAMLNFINETATQDPLIGFLIFPRYPDKFSPKVDLPNNVIIEKELNIYQGLLIADIHSTVNSTCVLESLSFGVPNILYNYRGHAADYYSETLTNKNHTFYANSPKDFIDIINSNNFLDKEEILKYSQVIFKSNFALNCNEAINSIINTK